MRISSRLSAVVATLGLASCTLPLHYGRATGPGHYETQDARSVCDSLIGSGSTVTDTDSDGIVLIELAAGSEVLGEPVVPGTVGRYNQWRAAWNTGCLFERLEARDGQMWGSFPLAAGDIVERSELPYRSAVLLGSPRLVDGRAYETGTKLYFDDARGLVTSRTEEERAASAARAEDYARERRASLEACMNTCAPLSPVSRSECEGHCRSR